MIAPIANDTEEPNNIYPNFVNDVSILTLSYRDMVGTDHWKKQLTELPAYDENGYPYYYWIVEKSSGSNAYEAVYQYVDGDGKTEFEDTALNGGNPGDSAKMILKNLKTESIGTTMPSTGSTGTAPYTAAGVTIMVTAGAFLILRRRKSANERDGPR